MLHVSTLKRDTPDNNYDITRLFMSCVPQLSKNTKKDAFLQKSEHYNGYANPKLYTCVYVETTKSIDL